MVFRATGIVWLALMMRAERAQRGDAGPGDDLASEWLLHGPTDPEVVEAAEPPIMLLAAE